MPGVPPSGSCDHELRGCELRTCYYRSFRSYSSLQPLLLVLSAKAPVWIAGAFAFLGLRSQSDGRVQLERLAESRDVHASLEQADHHETARCCGGGLPA